MPDIRTGTTARTAANLVPTDKFVMHDDGSNIINMTVAEAYRYGAIAVNALDFAGGDLGAKINAAFAAGHLNIVVPPGNYTISTTVVIPHAATIRFANTYGSPRPHINCATNDKPVFECIGSLRHWRIIGGIFDGNAVNTPSFFLAHGRPAGENQCGDTTPLEGVQCTGFWGVACVINIASEIATYQNCHLWNSGKGDSPYNGARAAVIIGNQDYWSLSAYTITPFRTTGGSCSAIKFENCDIRTGGDVNSSVFLLKGQVEDVTVVPMYTNSQGRATMVIEQGGGGSARRITWHGGGRSEANGHASPGTCPWLLVDGLGTANSGVYHFSVSDMSIFWGAAAGQPVIKTVNGGIVYCLTMGSNIHIENASSLIDHQTADLSWAEIKCRFNLAINCTGRTIDNSDIHIAGTVAGTIGTKTVVRSSNVNDWIP